jgi:L-malate glycosyltransferase
VTGPSVLMVASSAGFGGGERNLLDLARATCARGWNVAVALPAEGRLSALLDDAGIAWHEMPPDAIGGTRALRRLYAEAEPDIVHAHGLRASLPARLARVGAPRRLVYSMHGLHYLHYPSALKRAAFQTGERLLRPLADRFVCVSEADLAAAIAARVVVERRAVVIRNGVPAPALPDRAVARASLGLDERPAVLSLTRLEPEKGVDVLLATAEHVRAQGIDARFLVAGEGSQRETAEAIVRDKGLDAVELLGFRSDIGTLLAAADVFLLTSRWEGLPYTVLEAMAAGLPVIAPAVGGVPEAVEDGVTGFLARPGDVEGFSADVARLCGDADLRASMGAAGRERWAKAFSLDAMLAAFEALYDELVDVRAIER